MEPLRIDCFVVCDWMGVGGSTCGVCRKKREGGPEAEEARRDLSRFEASSV
jgi:hypothetical protein